MKYLQIFNKKNLIVGFLIGCFQYSLFASPFTDNNTDDSSKEITLIVSERNSEQMFLKHGSLGIVFMPTDTIIELLEDINIGVDVDVDFDQVENEASKFIRSLCRNKLGIAGHMAESVCIAALEQLLDGCVEKNPITQRRGCHKVGADIDAKIKIRKPGEKRDEGKEQDNEHDHEENDNEVEDNDVEEVEGIVI